MSEWTKTPPTEPGKYWYKDRRGNKEIVEVIRCNDNSLRVYEFGLCGAKPVEDMLGEWHPTKIEEPK